MDIPLGFSSHDMMLWKEKFASWEHYSNRVPWWYSKVGNDMYLAKKKRGWKWYGGYLKSLLAKDLKIKDSGLWWAEPECQLGPASGQPKTLLCLGRTSTLGPAHWDVSGLRHICPVCGIAELGPGPGEDEKSSWFVVDQNRSRGRTVRQSKKRLPGT